MACEFTGTVAHFDFSLLTSARHLLTFDFDIRLPAFPMDADSFLLLGAIVLVATIAVGFLGWPKPPPEKPKRPEPASRWAVFRLHPGVLLEKGGTAAERLPDGPRLSAAVPYRPERPRL